MNKGHTTLYTVSRLYYITKFDNSQVSTVCYLFLSYKAPLYGRKTGQMKILPFDFGNVCHYLKKYSYEDRAMAYGLVGGTPQYVLQFDDAVSIEDNIKKIFLNSSSFIYEEPENLLKQEVREPAVYNAIITTVAGGAAKVSEISTRIDESTNVCSAYLKNLISLGLIHRETPYGEKGSRKTLYMIRDNMFRFWYRFIPENTSLIARGAADLAYKRIEPHLNNYMGKVFDDICKQYLWKLLLKGTCPILFKDLGRWWGNDPSEKRQTEIDIMGEQDKNTALFAECKWTNEYVDQGVLQTLLHRSCLFHYNHTYLYVFAKTGFTEGCLELSKELGNVSLVTFGEMMDVFISNISH